MQSADGPVRDRRPKPLRVRHRLTLGVTDRVAEGTKHALVAAFMARRSPRAPNLRIPRNSSEPMRTVAMSVRPPTWGAPGSMERADCKLHRGDCNARATFPGVPSLPPRDNRHLRGLVVPGGTERAGKLTRGAPPVQQNGRQSIATGRGRLPSIDSARTESLS